MQQALIKVKNRLLKSDLFKDSFWALTGNVFGKGLALLASIIVARFLGKDLFGMYGLIRTTLLSIAVFSTFGLGYTATKFIAEYSKKSSEKINSIIRNITQITLITGTLCAILIFIFSKHLATYLDSADLYVAIRYLAVIIIFNSITTTQTGILAGFKKFKHLARINLINGLVTFVLSIILTYFYSLNGALTALLISQAYNCLQNYVEVKRSVRNMGEQLIPFSIKKELVMFSFPVALQEMTYSISSWILPILIVKFSNIGEVGLYNAATQWSSVILFIPGTLRNVIFSHLSSHTDNENMQRVIVKKMLGINFVATLIPFIIVWLLSGFIVSGYGSSFNSLKTVLNISIFTTIFTCMSGVINRYYITSGKAWFTFIVQTCQNIIIIISFVAISNINAAESGALNMAASKVVCGILFFVFYVVLFNTDRKNV